MLEECTKCVFMGDYNHFFAVHCFAADLIVPKRDNTIECVLQRLYARQSILVNKLVFLI